MSEVLESDAGGGYRAFLVTSSLEATWPADEPIVFLGQWCLRYSRRDVWSALDYSVAHYHWDDRARIPEDLAYVSGIYESLLIELSMVLNQIHGVDYSVRYWRIVVGWWLFYFTQILFDRWRVIVDAARTYPNAVLTRVPAAAEMPASPDMARFLEAILDDSWNESLWADLAEGWTDLTVLNLNPTEPSPSPAIEVSVPSSSTRPSFRRSVYLRLSGVLDWLGRGGILSRQKVSLHADYLRRTVKFRFELHLGQIPVFSAPRPLPESPAKAQLREWELAHPQGDAFASMLAVMVPRYIPTCYLEGYGDAVQISAASGWPRTPIVIMTANAFASDDRWKLWAGGQCESGARLVVAQHGGHYGAGAWSATQMNEIAMSDRYLSWGWEDPRTPKVHRAPATKLIGMRRRKFVANGICLQITCALQRHSDMIISFPIGSQFQHYLDDQLLFAATLANEVRNDLVVRLQSKDYGWELERRWKDSEPLVTLDTGHSDLRLLLRKTRLVVATYNATTFIESFVQGIPTVLFWDPHYWELSEAAKPHFDRLRRASVFFEDPLLCAKHVNAIWNDVPTWWASEQVQEAVHSFCNEYAYVGRRPFRELKAALIDW